MCCTTKPLFSQIRGNFHLPTASQEWNIGHVALCTALKKRDGIESLLHLLCVTHYTRRSSGFCVLSCAARFTPSMYRSYTSTVYIKSPKRSLAESALRVQALFISISTVLIHRQSSGHRRAARPYVTLCFSRTNIYSRTAARRQHFFQGAVVLQSRGALERRRMTLMPHCSRPHPP